MNGAPAHGLDPVEVLAEAARARFPGMMHIPRACNASLQYQPTSLSRLPIGSRRLGDRRREVCLAHRTASVPRTTVDMADRNWPEPCATATSAFWSCRAPASPPVSYTHLRAHETDS